MYRPDARRGFNYHDYQAELRETIKRIDARYIRESANEHHAASKIPKVLSGFACVYNVIHRHKGRNEMFAKGCFNGSLHGVMFHIDHNLLSKKLGDQGDGNLEIFDTPIGLAFRLKLAPDDIERIGGRDQMSTMYQEREVEFQQIGNKSVRVIKSASLFEISVVYVGAVGKTFAVVRDASSVGCLSDDATRSFPSASAFAVLQRALLRLSTL
jgi:phage head maturation protease